MDGRLALATRLAGCAGLALVLDFGFRLTAVDATTERLAAVFAAWVRRRACELEALEARKAAFLLGFFCFLGIPITR